MKRTYYYIGIIAVMAAMITVACSDEIAGIQSGSGQKISLTGDIEQVYMTRVNDNGFADGDEMGVYIVDYEGSTPGTLLNSGNRADNLRHTYDYANAKWSSAYDVYFKDEHTPIDIYGYYPFSSPDDVNAYDFEVVKDQSKTAANGVLGGYEASDFLWGKVTNVAPTEQKIRLSMYHRMSTARITLVEGTGFATGEWASLQKNVLIMNTVRKSKINLSDGSVTPQGAAPAAGIIPYKNGDEFRAIVVPQTIASGTVLFAITVDGVNYTFKKEADFAYQQEKMHNFSIKVDKKSASGDYTFTLMDESITAWVADNISHDGIAKEYVVINVPKAGTLSACIKAANKNYTQLQNLKITGQIAPKDFYFMKDSMAKLLALNIKEVSLTDEYGVVNNEITDCALLGRTNLYTLVLPDKLKKIGVGAFSGTSITGSLNIPEGVTEIGDHAFEFCKNLTGTLTLPATLEYIRGCAFELCGFTTELRLPESLKEIGSSAFQGCPFHGTLKLPDKLQSLGSGAFEGCHLTGNLDIPQGISKIGGVTFQGCGFDGTLKLHDGITEIGVSAFDHCHFRGQLVLPKNLMTISKYAFMGNSFSGELKLPSKLVTIEESAFFDNNRLTGVLEIPETVQIIEGSAFSGCSMLESLVLPASLETIKDGVFSMCTGLGRIVCKNTIPPHIESSTFDGVPKDNFTLEVPESAVAQYKTTANWNAFKRIGAHHELISRPSDIICLNAQHKHTVVLNAQGDWTVESKPDWCSLSAMSGSKKTELTVTVDELAKGGSDRVGKIVFKLKDYDYTDTCTLKQYNYSDYSEDEAVTLQTHSQGKGINLLFLGDGFNAKDIADGTYLKDMKLEVENFFSIEPYKTYRNYFNVYTLIAMSPESGIGTVNTIQYTKFGTTFTGSSLKGNEGEIFTYALKVPSITSSNLNKSLIVMIPNTTDYGGVTSMYADGSAISYCPLSTYDYPLDTRGVLQHEAGGHGFGKLGDEYIYYNSFIDGCTLSCNVTNFNVAKSNGWYANLSLTGKMNVVPWSHLIYDSRYSDIVDIYEGGYFHTRGVYRSEQNSCMNNNVSYFSTISREAIVRRIKEYAGETFSFEDFVAKDSRSITLSAARTRAIRDQYRGSNVGSFQHPPIIHRGKPKLR